MSLPTDNENWLIDEGHTILEKKAARGDAALRPIERLIRCWWTADYSTRNAGDLDTACDLDPNFLEDGVRLAAELALPLTKGAFARGKDALEATFFESFESVTQELRQACGH